MKIRFFVVKYQLVDHTYILFVQPAKNHNFLTILAFSAQIKKRNMSLFVPITFNKPYRNKHTESINIAFLQQIQQNISIDCGSFK